MSGNEGTGQNGQGNSQGPNEGQSSGGPEGLYAGRGHDELTSLIGDMGGNPKQGHQSGQQQQGGGDLLPPFNIFFIGPKAINLPRCIKTTSVQVCCTSASKCEEMITVRPVLA